MQILEVAQGMASVPEGSPKEIVVTAIEAADRSFLEKYPHCAQYHRPSFRLIEVPDNKTAPWGYEWWLVKDGRMVFHSAQYDSSG